MSGAAALEERLRAEAKCYAEQLRASAAALEQAAERLRRARSADGSRLIDRADRATLAMLKALERLNDVVLALDPATDAEAFVLEAIVLAQVWGAVVIVAGVVVAIAAEEVTSDPAEPPRVEEGETGDSAFEACIAAEDRRLRSEHSACGSDLLCQGLQWSAHLLRVAACSISP